MADIILIKTKKTSPYMLEHYNGTNCRETADSLHADVHVARIAKDKT